MTDRLLALDIETLTPPGIDADFEDLSCWRVFAIAVGFRAGYDAPIETEVFVRDDAANGERKLLAQLTNWTRDREPVDTLVTYNGKGFDLPILETRAEALLKSDKPHEQTLSFALHDALDIEHRDLFAELVDRRPEDEKWPKLDDALAKRGIEPATALLDGEPMSGARCPQIGRNIVAGEATPDERRALVEYARSDVRPLFELSDALERERHAGDEADIVTDGGTDTATETVLLASADDETVEVYHLPDDGRPKCGNDGAESRPYRAVSRDHPAVQHRRVCKNCDGSFERCGPDEQRTSLRTAIANGEVEVADD